MLSIEECRKYFPNQNLKDEDLEKLRNFYYYVINQIIDDYIQDDRTQNGCITKQNN